MKIIIGATIKNEADRYLIPFLDTVKQIADEIIIVDDGSIDNSFKIAQRYTQYVYKSNEQFIKDEHILRKFLWDKCCEFVEDRYNTWIGILDADEIISESSIEVLKTDLQLASQTEADSVGYQFFDMWNETQYRDDKLWCAHKSPTVHFVKYKPDMNYVWWNRPLHCGRLPINSHCNIYLSLAKVKHMAYVKAEDRKKKYENYMKLDGKGLYGIMAQYKSILDENPNLVDFR